MKKENDTFLLKLCPIGFYGNHCKNECPPDKFGYNCLNNCSCDNHSKCDSITGKGLFIILS